jgi:hypothetical protein
MGRLKQLHPQYRMGADGHPLLVGQRPGLLQNSGRHAQLANIVQQESEPEEDQALLDPVDALLAIEIGPAIPLHHPIAERDAERGHG